jgi:hypothetical protein
MEVNEMKKEELLLRIQMAGNSIKTGAKAIKYSLLLKSPWQVKLSSTVLFLFMMSDSLYILFYKDVVYSGLFHKVDDLWFKLEVTEHACQKDLLPFRKALLVLLRYPAKPRCFFKPI